MKTEGFLRQAKRRVVALAGFLLLGVAGQAQASDLGCKILLCLANPAGPQAVAECVDPINTLYDMLAHFDPFPSCEMAGDANAHQVNEWYNRCPAGTTALGEGVTAIQGTFVPDPATFSGTTYTGIGDGEGLAPPPAYMGGPGAMKPVVCVGSKVGTMSKTTWVTPPPYMGAPHWETTHTDVYSSVVMLDPVTNPRAIDVYYSGALQRRVRW